MKPDFATHFLRGIDHFNQLEFWEAHEAWEELWLAASTDIEQYLQGLIQLAAAYHHVRRGTLRGAVRLFDAALRRLAPFPPGLCGLDRGEAEKAARLHRDWAAGVLARASGESLSERDYPKLRRIRDDAPLVPPNENW
ncbi:MAG TPA: DUF309 domain-containing protein [Thermoanaerobaculia bacterium]|nr:DUF309 domain-containing protein [Thermoanaerobaculia bacterium]